jgi:hypothetical protein
MTASKSRPARPSLESLRKQAKTLARDIVAGDAGAIARARMQLPDVDLPLTQRHAQLVIAREGHLLIQRKNPGARTLRHLTWRDLLIVLIALSVAPPSSSAGCDRRRRGGIPQGGRPLATSRALVLTVDTNNA